MIAQTADQREQLVSAIVGEFEALWGEMLEAEGADAVEKRVLTWTRAVGRKVLDAALQAGIERREEQPVNFRCSRISHTSILLYHPCMRGVH